MKTGRFVVIEGPDGAGKSTLVDGLEGLLRAGGDPPVVVREPGGTDVAELLRRELLDPGREFDPEVELLYLATARADLVARRIRPALSAGKVVLSDRFTLSTLAYQGAGRGLPMEHLEWANRVATGGLEPDLVLVLDLDPIEARNRQSRAGKEADRIDLGEIGFSNRVIEFYRSARGPGIHHLDAAGSAQQVLESAWRRLAQADPERFQSRIEEQRA